MAGGGNGLRFLSDTASSDASHAPISSGTSFPAERSVFCRDMRDVEDERKDLLEEERVDKELLWGH